MKQVKKTIYVLIVLLAVVSGLVFANREFNREPKLTPKSLPIADKKTVEDERKKWEASPDGVHYKAWETSPEGKKVYASYDKVKKSIQEYSEMEAVVTSLTFQRTNGSSSGPKWLIVSIDGETYMMQFTPKDFQQLRSLQVNDKIMVKSRSAGFSPNHPYLILSGDYIAHNHQVLYERVRSKNDPC
jgi:hypothetical protein